MDTLLARPHWESCFTNHLDMDNMSGWTGCLQHLLLWSVCARLPKHWLQEPAPRVTSHAAYRGRRCATFCKEAADCRSCKVSAWQKAWTPQDWHFPSCRPWGSACGSERSCIGLVTIGCYKQCSYPPFPIAKPFLNTPDAVQCPGPVPSLSFPLVNASIPC